MKMQVKHLDLYKDKAEREEGCYHYCIDLANACLLNDNFSDAIKYLENAKRSLNELDRIKKYQQSIQDCSNLLLEIDSQTKVNQVMRRYAGHE